MNGKLDAKNIVIIEIKVGNLPLQGIKLLVIIAKSLSLLELIILQPTTAQALHPKPIHIVKDCFPFVPAFLKKWSKLKAILGKYPRSSSSVKRGKNIAIGGSITDTTHDKVVYIPSIIIPLRNIGAFIKSKNLYKSCFI